MNEGATKPLTLDDLAKALTAKQDIFTPRRALGPDDGWFVQFKDQIYPIPSFDDPPPVPCPTFDEALDACLTLNAKLAARAILTTIKESGWTIVPVEATEEMTGAAYQAGGWIVLPIWQAIQSAAPKIEGE